MRRSENPPALAVGSVKGYDADELTEAELARVEFFREPSWRFKRASMLHNSQSIRTPLSNEDDLVLDAVNYLRLNQKFLNYSVGDRERKRRLYQRYPLVCGAMELNQRPVSELPKIGLEARILAEQSDKEIANALHRPEPVVRAYRQLFFDVADRLDCIEYIAGWVIGPVFRQGLDGIQTESLAKYFGYYLGPLAVEQIMYGATRGNVPYTQAELDGRLEETLSMAIKTQATAMSIAMVPTRFDVRTLIEGYTSLVNLQREEQDAHQEQTWMAAFIGRMRENHPIPHSLPDIRRLRDDRNEPATPRLLEPRADERNQAAGSAEYAIQLAERLDAEELPLPQSEYSAKVHDR